MLRCDGYTWRDTFILSDTMRHVPGERTRTNMPHFACTESILVFARDVSVGFFLNSCFHAVYIVYACRLKLPIILSYMDDMQIKSNSAKRKKNASPLNTMCVQYELASSIVAVSISAPTAGEFGVSFQQIIIIKSVRSSVVSGGSENW